MQTIEKNDTFFTSLGSRPEVHVLCLRLYQKLKALHPNWCSFIAGFVVAELPAWHLCGGTPGVLGMQLPSAFLHARAAMQLL